MRNLVIILMALSAATPVSAQGNKTASCENSAKIVMEAVQARKDGVSERRTERELRRALNRDTGTMVAQWIYGLPEDQLTLDVGRTWVGQCLSR